VQTIRAIESGARRPGKRHGSTARLCPSSRQWSWPGPSREGGA
jgi:hypothetical protein